MDYDDRAYPRKWIEAAQQIAAANAAKAIAGLTPALTGELAGCRPEWRLRGRPRRVRVHRRRQLADLLRASDCNRHISYLRSAECILFFGAAGGGVWKTTNALAATPTWADVRPWRDSSNAIGSIVFDPNDAEQTIYVGTGEPNGSSDSEAGVGLYKSTDGGTTWSLVAGSTAGNAPCASNPASFDLSGCHGPFDRRNRDRPGQRQPHLHWHRCSTPWVLISQRRSLHAARLSAHRSLRVD